jgi:YbgC/YbaW family acyl-CoA thioester hydrolase
MLIYRTQVKLRDTDATGVLYFTEQFRMASEAFEEFLKEKGLILRELIASDYLMPVVHAEADYFKPLKVGEGLEIQLKIAQVGTSSMTLQCNFFSLEQKIEVGRVQIVHVVIDREKKTSVPIPDFLRKIFETEINAVAK